MADAVEFSFTRRGRTDADPGRGLKLWADQLQAGLAVSGARMPGAVRAHLSAVVERLAAKHGNKWPGGTGRDGLSSRSGALLSALRAGVLVTGSSIADAKGSLAGPDYLALHEYGGTVQPHGTRYLAIPLPAALAADGTPIKDSPRAWADTFVQKSRAGNLLIFRREGSGIVPLYALKTSVTIPARFGARQAARDLMPYFTGKVLDAVLAGLKA